MSVMRKESMNPPPKEVEVLPSTVKGWWEGEGSVIGGTGDDMIER